MDDSDLLDIKNLGSAGTPTSTLAIAVQQQNVDNIAQQILLEELAVTEELGGQAWVTENKFMTPNGFRVNYGTTIRYGTLLVASSAAMIAKTDAKSAITPSNIDELTEIQTTPGRDIQNSDIDTTPTDGTVNILNLKACFEGKKVTLNGLLEFKPNVNTASADIVIKDMETPSYTQAGSGCATMPSVMTFPLSFYMRQYTTPVNGLGSIKLELNYGGLNWNSTVTYTLGINIVYFTD